MLDHSRLGWQVRRAEYTPWMLGCVKTYQNQRKTVRCRTGVPILLALVSCYISLDSTCEVLSILTSDKPMIVALAGVQEAGSSELQIDVMRQLKAIYSDLLKGPSNLALPQLTGASTAQPEGQQQLTDSIRIMREKHVEYQVLAQHDLIKVCCAALYS